MTETDPWVRAQAVSAAIRAHYIWRHMLKHACGQDLDLQPFPPPSHLQHLLPGERA